MMLKDNLNRMIKKSEILSRWKYKWFKKQWRKINEDNFTVPVNCFNRRRVSVGKGTYGEICARHFGSEEEQLIIGNYCSIAPQVQFLLGGEHTLTKFSTYPFEQKYFGMENESVTKGPIIVEDDVWIGFGATILSGVHIGKGAVIAAGAMVVKDVPPYGIVGGVPAKLMRYRFDENIRNKLLQIDFAKLDMNQIKKNKTQILSDVTDENIDQICCLLEEKE